MRVVAILQARLGSTRLPGKVMLPLGGKPMVQNIIERVQRAKSLHAVVTGIPARDAMAFKDIHGEVYWPEHCVHEDDLVGRYLATATKFQADLIVRIPCDNPCVDPVHIDQAIASYLALPQIYVSTQYLHLGNHVYVDGVGAEVFSMSRLQWLDQATRGQALYREHPHKLFEDQHLIDSWNIYQRHADYSKTIRLDVNTQVDYEFIKGIYDHFGHNSFTTQQVVEHLTTQGVLA